MTEDQQEKVLEKHYDINVDYEWWDGDYHFGLSSKEIKSRRITYSDCGAGGLFSYKEIYFDLGWGSYIQFKGLAVNGDDTFRKFLRVPKRLWEACNWWFNEMPRYGCSDSNTEFQIEPDYYDGRDFTEKQQALVDRAVSIMTDKISEALSDLQATYEHLTTREAIEETLKLNEYTFTQDGEIAS